MAEKIDVFNGYGIERVTREELGLKFKKNRQALLDDLASAIDEERTFLLVTCRKKEFSVNDLYLSANTMYTEIADILIFIASPLQPEAMIEVASSIRLYAFTKMVAQIVDNKLTSFLCALKSVSG